MRLFHYCCQHSARSITTRGFLLPNGADFFGVGLVWLTDQEEPNREGLGLTSHLTGLKCDRLECRYVVDADESVQRWMDSPIRRALAFQPYFVTDFEGGRQPETWWVATRPIWAIRDRTWELPQAVVMRSERV